MRRGPRPSIGSVGIEALEAELAALKARQAELRQQLGRAKSIGTGVSALEAKLTKQLESAKWTAEQIRKLQPSWEEWAFYRSVEPVQPKPRGRRPRSAGSDESED